MTVDMEIELLVPVPEVEASYSSRCMKSSKGSKDCRLTHPNDQAMFFNVG